MEVIGRLVDLLPESVYRLHILDLPVEIISNILLWCGKPEESTIMEYTQTLLCVCNLWHNVAIADPSLWTKILITNIYRPGSFKDRRRVEIFLKRSKGKDISLILARGEEWDEDELDLETLVADHIDRITTLQILSSRAMENLENGRLASKMRRLETLILEFGGDLRFHPLAGVDIPSLLHLKVTEVHVHWSMCSFPNLKELQFLERCRWRREEEVKDFLEALKGMVQLEELRVTIGIRPYPYDIPMSNWDGLRRVTLPKLVKLEVEGFWPGPLVGFLRLLDTPKLQEVGLIGREYRNFGQLYEGQAEDWTEIRPSLPELKKAKLWFWDDPAELLRRLTRDAATAVTIDVLVGGVAETSGSLNSLVKPTSPSPDITVCRWQYSKPGCDHSTCRAAYERPAARPETVRLQGQIQAIAYHEQDVSI